MFHDIMNAFTCTGPYAILILRGIKQTEIRSAWPKEKRPFPAGWLTA